jgi:hypothetical protein
MAVGTGHLTTVAWGTATALNALKVISIDASGPSIGTVRTSDLTTTGSHTYIANALKEEGEFTITYQFDPTVAISIGGSAETVIIAWGGAGTTNESTGPAIRTAWKPGTVTVDSSELMTCEVTCKCTGAWTHQQN